jgi:hypothetical protein
MIFFWLSDLFPVSDLTFAISACHLLFSGIIQCGKPYSGRGCAFPGHIVQWIPEMQEI